MDKLLIKFLNANGYFNASNDMQLQLRSHPDFPSLKAITDTLDYFGIANIAANVPKDSLGELPESFLALLEEEESPRIVLAIRRKNNLVLYDETLTKETIPYERFKTKWTGTIIAVEAAEHKQRKTANTGNLILVAAFVLLTAVQLHAFHLPAALLTALSLAGAYLSYLIVKEEVGFHSKTVAKVCGAVNKTGNCADIINASGSKLFNIVALSDLCVTFFAGSILIYTLLGINYFFVSVILLLSLPVVLFSLYRQAVTLKQWCALCLGVAGILIVKSGIVLLLPPTFDFSPGYILKALFLMVAVYAVWQRVKPVLINAVRLQKTKEEFLRFKRNQNLFLTMLHKEPLRNNKSIPEENRLAFGALTPQITINAVTNPLCGFCTNAFKTYYKLLKSHPDTVKINVIFNVPVAHKAHKATQIATRIAECYAEAPESALEAMNNWFNNRDTNAWQAQYGISEVSDNRTESILKAHQEWCAENKITYTPATIIDGYVYPKEYPTEDLLFFIDDMLLEKTEDPEAVTGTV